MHKVKAKQGSCLISRFAVVLSSLFLSSSVLLQSYSRDLQSVMSHLDPESLSQLDTFSVSGGIQSLSFSKGVGLPPPPPPRKAAHTHTMLRVILTISAQTCVNVHVDTCVDVYFSGIPEGVLSVLTCLNFVLKSINNRMSLTGML